MSIADSNRVRISYIPEVTFGVTPATPVLQELNLTSEGLKSNNTTVTSETLRSDRNVSDITNVGGGAGGDTAFELRYNDIEPLLEAALQNSFLESIVSIDAGDTSIALATDVITITGTNGDGIVVGQFLRITTAPIPSNNGDYQVVSITIGATTDIQVIDADTGLAVVFTVDSFTSGNGQVYGKLLRNGVTAKSFTMEKEFTDIAQFHVFRGMRIGALSLNFESQALLTGSFTMNGLSQLASGVTIATSVTPPSTNEVMNASGNVVRIWEGGQAITGAIFQSMSIELNNNPRDQAQIGSAALAGIATGRCDVTGSIAAYFEDSALLDKFTNSTQSSFRLQVQDSTGNAYIFTLPAIKYTDFTVAAGGSNSDIIQEGSYGATIDSSGLYAIQIDALAA